MFSRHIITKCVVQNAMCTHILVLFLFCIIGHIVGEMRCGPLGKRLEIQI